MSNKDLEKMREMHDLKNCEMCIHHKKMSCPNSSECYAKSDKPHFEGWFPLLSKWLKERGKY